MSNAVTLGVKRPKISGTSSISSLIRLKMSGPSCVSKSLIGQTFLTTVLIGHKIHLARDPSTLAKPENIIWASRSKLVWKKRHTRLTIPKRGYIKLILIYILSTMKFCCVYVTNITLSFFFQNLSDQKVFLRLWLKSESIRWRLLELPDPLSELSELTGAWCLVWV